MPHEVKSAAIQRGDVLPPMDPLETAPDGFLVLAVRGDEVECVDVVERAVYRWRRCRDGIRADVCEVESDGQTVSYNWVPVPVTLYGPPPAVAAHLRGAS